MIKTVKFFSLLLLLVPLFIDADIVIDGKLDEDEWLDAKSIEEFFIINPYSLESPDLDTKVLIHSDKMGIYFGFINQQSYETRDRRKHARDGLRQNHDRNEILASHLLTVRNYGEFGPKHAH